MDMSDNKPAPAAECDATPLSSGGRSTFPTLISKLERNGSQAHASIGNWRLSSHFQPVLSLSHRRAVGHEALMRVRRIDDDHPLSPLEVLGACCDFEETLELDRLTRLVHMANFRAQADETGWLFINMNSEVFLRAGRPDYEPVLQQMLEHLRIRPERIVIEVLENAVRDDADFGHAVSFFRNLGCLIALDDFGAGHSNFDRVWRIQPEIVKLDRSLIVQAGRSLRVRRMLAQMVSLLHECGALVLMEGIETGDEAIIALEADVDFVQGYYFGRPQQDLVGAQTPAVIHELWRDFDSSWRTERKTYYDCINPYKDAVRQAALLLTAGRSLAESCAGFLELPGAEFCYLLDSNGQQIGTNHWAPTAQPNRDARFSPVANAANALWARRPYFRRAVESFGHVQITRPYLSISSAKVCVTLSMGFKVGDEIRVVCGDLRWQG